MSASLAVLLTFLLGCPPSKSVVPDELLPPGLEQSANMPDYATLIRRYNARLEGLDTLSCRTHVEAVWIDDKGKRRRESGKGRLIFRRPLDTALTVEAFGKTVMWAGSNQAMYWLFVNLHEGGELYFGRFIGQGPTRRTLVVPPDAVPFLLGLMPLTPNPPDGTPEVEALRGYALIEPPGMGMRMLLEPATGTPRRVDLIDRDGVSSVICLLDGDVTVKDLVRPEYFVQGGGLVNGGVLRSSPGPRRVTLRNMDGQTRVVELPDRSDSLKALIEEALDAEGVSANEGWVIVPEASVKPELTLPEVATLYPVGEESKMVVEIKSADAQDRRVRDALFDLDLLRDTLKPDRVIDLDQPDE